MDEPKVLRLEGEYSGVRFGNAAIPEAMTAEEIFARLRSEPPTEAGEQGEPIRVGTIHVGIRGDGEWLMRLDDDALDIERVTHLPSGTYPVFLASPPPSGEPTEAEGQMVSLVEVVAAIDRLGDSLIRPAGVSSFIWGKFARTPTEPRTGKKDA